MTVFMSPRTHYEFGRHDSHRNMAWVTLLMISLIGVCSVNLAKEQKNDLYYLAALPLVPALFCKNGRRTIGRGVTEVFYGTLYTFTGVITNQGHYNEG